MLAVLALRRCTRADALFFMDVSLAEHYAAEAFTAVQPRTYFNPTNNQAMGWSIPAAIGAQRVFPGRQVVTLTGDGCFLMTAMEISTAARECLPVKFFVLDDQAYHYMQKLQQTAYGRTTATILAHLDYAALAKGFGVVQEVFHARLGRFVEFDVITPRVPDMEWPDHFREEVERRIRIPRRGHVDALGFGLIAGMDQRDGIVTVILEWRVSRGRPDRLVVDKHLSIGDIRFDHETPVHAAGGHNRRQRQRWTERPPECHRGFPHRSGLASERREIAMKAAEVNPTRSIRREISGYGTARGRSMA